MKVLLGICHEETWELLSQRLKRRGFEVAVAPDGQEVVDRSRIEAPDIVVIDPHLPTLDGWTAARMIRNDPATAAVPIIALTKHEMTGFIDSGCTDCSPVPIDFPNLLSKIEQYGPKS